MTANSVKTINSLCLQMAQSLQAVEEDKCHLRRGEATERNFATGRYCRRKAESESRKNNLSLSNIEHFQRGKVSNIERGNLFDGGLAGPLALGASAERAESVGAARIGQGDVATIRDTFEKAARFKRRKWPAAGAPETTSGRSNRTPNTSSSIAGWSM
jgi:hypothetical protein